MYTKERRLRKELEFEQFMTEEELAEKKTLQAKKEEERQRKIEKSKKRKRIYLAKVTNFSSGSHAEEFRLEGKKQWFKNISQEHFVDTDEETESVLKYYISRLRSLKYRISKCTKCGRIQVLKKDKSRRFIGKEVCYFCRSENSSFVWKSKTKQEEVKKERIRSDELQPFFRKLYSDYMKDIHRGCIVYDEFGNIKEF